MVENENKPAGILLLGGSGSRLLPLTSVLNKHLLPVYDKPMAIYALEFLQKSGIDKVVIVTTPRDIGPVSSVIGDSSQSGAKISYVVQEKPLGTAHAIQLCERYITENTLYTLWGDNIFEYHLRKSVASDLAKKCKLHLTRVDNARDFGVVEMADDGRIIAIEDKPKNPKSDIVCTGFMAFNSEVFCMINRLKPNNKGELDVMDVVRDFLRKGELECTFITGQWMDAGVSPETLFRAAQLARENGINK